MAENIQGSNNVANVITWLEKLTMIIKKIGVQNIFITILMLFVLIVVGQIAFNPGAVLQKVEKIQQEKHDESIAKRLSIDHEMRNTLIDLKSETNADRVFIFEAHNGGENLNGLPFIYADLTYAEPKKSSSWLIDEYKNVRLMRYPLAGKLYDETFIFLKLEELKDIDPELYYRLEKESVTHLALMIMYGKKNPIGMIGVTYISDKNIPTKNEMHKQLSQHAQIISKMLINN